MSLHSAFKTSDAATAGKWHEFPSLPNDDGSIPGFKLTYMSPTNPAYQAALEAVAKEHRRDIELDIMNEDAASPIMRGVFAKVICVDWRNIEDEHGQKLGDYTTEKGDEYFAGLPDLYLTLVTEARKIGNYRAAKLGEVAKK